MWCWKDSMCIDTYLFTHSGKSWWKIIQLQVVRETENLFYFGFRAQYCNLPPSNSPLFILLAAIHRSRTSLFLEDDNRGKCKTQNETDTIACRNVFRTYALMWFLTIIMDVSANCVEPSIYKTNDEWRWWIWEVQISDFRPSGKWHSIQGIFPEIWLNCSSNSMIVQETDREC